MFGSTELWDMLPWDKLPPSFESNKKKYERKVKKFLNKLGLSKVIYLKPKSKEVQKEIIRAVNNKDVKNLDNLLTRDNFAVYKLGRNYDVRILTDGKRVTSIAVDKGRKVFMRSEKPRPLGRSAMVVTFRAPKKMLTTDYTNVKVAA